MFHSLGGGFPQSKAFGGQQTLMKKALSQATGAVAQLGARAAAVTGAYIAATAVMLLAVIVLRGMVTPALLRNILGLVFLMSLSAGLEPGTIKAAALSEAGVEGADLVAYLGVGALKGALASPLLAFIWRLADPTMPFSTLAWTPLITIAGFWATDMRVLLDLRGRHTLAAGLKQGSLAGGVAIVGLLVALKTPLVWAVGVSTLARLALPLLVAALSRRPQSGGPIWREARRLLGDKRWIDLAAVSVIAAVGGSVDRVIGLRLLSPADYGAYYLIYELLTKFWLIPFVLGPILFARRASGDESDSLVRGAWGLTAAAGAAFLVVVGCVLIFAPGLLTRLVGASFGLAIFGFAMGVVVGSLVQLQIAHLQGAGRGRRTAVAMGLSAVLSAPMFWVCASSFGAAGLLWAFLAKTSLELALVSWRAKARGV